MKKKIILSLSVVILMLLSACGQNDQKDGDNKISESQKKQSLKAESTHSSRLKTSDFHKKSANTVSTFSDSGSVQDDSSSTTSNADASLNSDADSGSLLFNQFKKSDFSGLIGNWREVAVAGVGYHMKHGLQWSNNVSDLTNHLNVSNTQINDEEITLNNQGLTQAGHTLKPSYTEKSKVIEASVDDAGRQAMQNGSIAFYPKGVSADLNFNNGVMDDDSTDRIVLWTSNNGWTEVFARQ